MTTHTHPRDLATATTNLDGRSTRKIANNTYLQLRPAQDSIAVLYHATDVVIYHPDDTIELNSGGWYTVSTKARMNDFTPRSIQISSQRGRWIVFSYINHIHTELGPYADHMRLVRVDDEWQIQDETDRAKIAKEDAHNARIDKMIKVYTDPKNFDAGHKSAYSWTQERSCRMCDRICVGQIRGDSFEDTQHLVDHMLDGVYPLGLLIVASDVARGGTNGEFRASMVDLSRRDVRNYLRQVLYTGPVATNSGRRPRFALSASQS
jgi:hypothetical protein